MASTAISLVSQSPRATPRSRVDTPCAVVLPKIQVASTDISATQSQGSNGDLDLPVDKPRSTDIPRLPVREFSLNHKEYLVPATIRELELEIEPKSKNVHSNLQDTPRFGGITGNPLRSRTIPDRAKVSKHQQTFTHPARPKTVTWPSLQYKVWVDTSNLSFHRLGATGRPMSRTCSSRQCERNFTKQNAQRVIGIGNGRATQLNGDTEFVIGSPEKWHVSLSHVNKISTVGASTTQRIMLDPTKRKNPMSSDSFSRLPSRMGRNSLNCFLDNSKGETLSNLQVCPRLKSQIKNRPDVDAGMSIDSSLRDSRTSALKLRGVVRNPDIHVGQQQGRVKVKTVTISTRPGSRNEHSSSKNVRNDSRTGAKKHLSFKIPFGSSEWETEGIEEKHKWIRGGRKGVVNSDISSIQAPVLHLDDAYHVTKYISTK